GLELVCRRSHFIPVDRRFVGLEAKGQQTSRAGPGTPWPRILRRTLCGRLAPLAGAVAGSSLLDPWRRPNYLRGTKLQLAIENGHAPCLRSSTFRPGYGDYFA